MRKPEFLSPTAISLFYANLDEYYLSYLADNKPPRIPQTKPMSVGSSFDAYAKSYLHEKLFGKNHSNSNKFQFQTIFEAQVEPQNRDYALQAGEVCFKTYLLSGAIGDLMMDLQSSIVDPRFEFEVTGTINGYREGYTKSVLDVPFRGKPDVFFVNKLGAHVVFDWKVNGYDSKWGASPMQGYVRLRDGVHNMGEHKNAHLMMDKGIMINAANRLEDFNRDWARQLSIYAWLCGEDIGADFIVGIDQLACRPSGKIKVAEHRLKISNDAQWKFYAEAQNILETINSEHIFRDMTLEESKGKCMILDKVAASYKEPKSDNDEWLAQISRQ
jgi:hypothetical protein